MISGLIPVIDGTNADQLAALKATAANLTNYRVMYLDSNDNSIKVVGPTGTVAICKVDTGAAGLVAVKPV